MLFGQEHVERYRETDGEEGHDWNGTVTLLLTTTGRKSGEERTTPLIYGEADDAFLIVASNGGEDKPPAWYLNLREQDEVGVQVKADRFSARTRIATDEEKPAYWEQMVARWPDYDNYQEKTDRTIPIVVLERA